MADRAKTASASSACSSTTTRPDFGVEEPKPKHAKLEDLPPSYGFRTGLSSARATDLDDDSYDLSWIDGLSPNVAKAIGQLRQLLDHRERPDRPALHVRQFEARLYGCRDAFTSALDEYDDACRQHDAAMDEIRAALFAKFGRLPILETYKQAAVRCAKAKDWEAVVRWCARGIKLYGADAANPKLVEDLRKRLAHANAKIEARNRPKPPRPRATKSTPMMETLTCHTCGRSFERIRTRGANRTPARTVASQQP